MVKNYHVDNVTIEEILLEWNVTKSATSSIYPGFKLAGISDGTNL